MPSVAAWPPLPRRPRIPVWAWHWLDAEAPAGPWTTAQRIALGPDAQARKQHAMAAFATQTGKGEALGCEPILPEHVLARFRRSFEVLIG